MSSCATSRCTVEDLLLLARLDQQRALDITDVDLLVLAADAVHDAKAREPARPVTLVAGSGAVHVLGDEHKLRQVLTNLVTNALTHTPAGTPVRVAVRRHVPSTGRGTHHRGGSGLGLAITAAILEAHNGRIELHTASLRGTTFRILLPLA